MVAPAFPFTHPLAAAASSSSGFRFSGWPLVTRFTKESIRRDQDDRHLRDKFLDSAFLRDLRDLAR